MTDVVVTVPKRLWQEWISEGDLAHNGLATLDPRIPAAWAGEMEYGFNLATRGRPTIDPGERVYIVAHGQVRGYAPLVYIAGAGEAIRRFGAKNTARSFALVRRGNAVACTIPDPVQGFQGWRYRWWDRDDEVAFPDWRTAGVL